MVSILRVLFIHGVGEQTSDFAAEARQNLRVAAARRGLSLFSTQVHWAPHADRAQRAFLADVERRGSRGNITQRLVVGTLSDALMYVTNPALQKQVFQQLDEQMFLLGGRGTIIAHSLGGLIAADYLRARPEHRNVRLVTMGCNIGLFHLGLGFQPVPVLGAPGRWLNVFSRRDMLGYPLAGGKGLEHVQDFEVSVGGWFRGWTGLAHTQYWGDKNLFQNTLPRLLGL